MPVPVTLRINEIFHSFQGEGSRAGQAAIFIRLAGCSVGCDYCDTKKAWSGGQKLSLEQILADVMIHRRAFPRAMIVLTGGEPLEQDILPLVVRLKGENFNLAIETHGTLFQDLPLDWWTVSPKDKTHYHIHPLLLPRIGEIKLIVTASLGVSVVQELRQRVPRVPIFLQPEEGGHQPFQTAYTLFKQCQEMGLEDIRCGVQLHRVYRVP